MNGRRCDLASIDYYIEAGSLFTKRHVARGDFIYAVTVRDGELFLIGKLEVGDRE
jgi:hypothetical protein